MTETLILSGFHAIAGFALPCDLRETITIPAQTKMRNGRAMRHGLVGGTSGEPKGKLPWTITQAVGCRPELKHEEPPALAHRG